MSELPDAASAPAPKSEESSSISARFPQGSIELIYCELCGGLILGGEKDSLPAPGGQGRHCKKCARASGRANPAADVAPTRPKTHETKIIAIRPESSKRLPPAKAQGSSRFLRSPVDTPHEGSRRLAAGEKEGSKVPLAVAACGAVALVVLGVVMFGGSKPKEEKTAAAATPPQAKPRQSPVPVEVRNPAAEPPRARPDWVPAATAPSASTETAKPPEHAPARAEPPVASPAVAEAPTAKKEEPAAPPAQKEPEKAPLPAVTGTDKTLEEEDLETKKKAQPPASGSNPFLTKPETAPEAPAPAKAPEPAKPKPKPAFVRGQPCDLFPPERSSVVVERTFAPDANRKDPLTVKLSQYDGWLWNARNFTSLSVKDGICHLAKPGSLVLDGFPCKEYDLAFEVDLASNSALALQYGSATLKDHVVSLLIVTSSHVMPGTWEPNKTQGNVKAQNKEAKPHGIRDPWIPLRVSVRLASIEVIANAKSIFKGAPPQQTQLPVLGFLPLGLNNNQDPGFKLRKVILVAP